MNLTEITFQNAKTDVATTERQRLNSEQIELWQERNEITENAIKRGYWLPGELEVSEQLAQAAFDLDWLAGRLFDVANQPPLTATNDGPERYKMNGVY